MKVEIIVATPEPITVISRAAGTSWGKNDISKKRVETCINRGHLSVLEHVCVTWKISDISRSCSHQLVRHRLASYTEKSLRYTEPQEGDWYVIPEVLKDHPYSEAYKTFMDSAETLYFELLDHGVKKEDARFLLPLATKTEITVTMNLREFLHFYDLRSDKKAQWEIREMADEMFDTLREYSSDWAWLLETYMLSKQKYVNALTMKFAADNGLALASQ